MSDDQQTIHSVAGAMGGIITPSGAVFLPVLNGFLYPQGYTRDLLALAMCAQAWAIGLEKPWLPLIETGFVREDVETVLRFVCVSRSTRHQVCDFTDAVSHAWGILRCVEEVATMNPEGEVES